MIPSVLLLVAFSAADDFGVRDIIREQVAAEGHVQPALNADTGWNTLHAFRWQMLVVDDQAGTLTPVRIDQVFRTGTRFKLRVETFTNLYIYVLNVNSGGGVAALFPQHAEEHLLIKAGQEALVPPDPPGGRDRFRFEPPAGTEDFYILASPQPLPWANPKQHLPPEQEAFNARALNDLAKRTATKAVRDKSLKQVVERRRASPNARSKDIDLLPPPTDGGQLVIHASETPNDSQPFMVYVILKHRP